MWSGKLVLSTRFAADCDEVECGRAVDPFGRSVIELFAETKFGHTRLLVELDVEQPSGYVSIYKMEMKRGGARWLPWE